MLKTKKQSSKNIKLYNTKKNIHIQQIIIHISGASGSGKTTLGNKLKETFGSKIIVKDLDDLFNEYVTKNKIENLKIITGISHINLVYFIYFHIQINYFLYVFNFKLSIILNLLFFIYFFIFN